MRMNKLLSNCYISCFGINNFPINIYAKLYATPLISEAMSCPKVVEFMGDDLNIMLNIIPHVQKNHYCAGNHVSL